MPEESAKSHGQGVLSKEAIGAASQDRFSSAKTLAFFPLLLMSAGGLSILSVCETLVSGIAAPDTPLRFLLNGYGQVTHVMGLILEPLLLPIVAMISGWLGEPLVLKPVWRPMLLIGSIVAVAFWRVGTSKDTPNWVHAAFGATVGIGVLLGVLVVGVSPLGQSQVQQIVWAVGSLVPLISIWWVQGVLVGLLVLRADNRQWSARQAARAALVFLAIFVAIPICAILLIGALAVALSFIPAVKGHVALALWGGLVFFVGLFCAAGDHRNPPLRTAGITILGGIVAAIGIYAANWLYLLV